MMMNAALFRTPLRQNGHANGKVQLIGLGSGVETFW